MRLIDADALIADKATNIMEDGGFGDPNREVVFVSDIENATTISPSDVVEVVRGDWEKRELNFGTFYRCSICGETISGFPMYKFCHACGARMNTDKSVIS